MGRGITQRDTANSRQVAVINQAFAKRFFQHEDPIGKHFGRSEMGASHQYEVVGVSKDARYLTYNLERPVGPFFMTPEVQHDVFPNPDFTIGDVRTHYLGDIVVVTKPGENVSDAALRRAIAAVDPNMPVNRIGSLREQVGSRFGRQRLMARLTSFFGVPSLLLASIGLYGVTAYNAGRRVNEIGGRMALGANRRHVVTIVLRGALALIVIGLMTGLPLTFATGRFLGNQLYGMNPNSPAVILVDVIALALCALAASLIPAFRASLISPLEALRAE
jgi:hypothetical protein